MCSRKAQALGSRCRRSAASNDSDHAGGRLGDGGGLRDRLRPGRRLVVDVDMLVASGRLPEEMRPWLTKLLLNLEAAELAKQERGYLDSEPGCFAAEFASRDQGAGVRTSGARRRSAAGRRGTSSPMSRPTIARFGLQPDSILPKAALEFYDSTNVAIADDPAMLLAAAARHRRALAEGPRDPRAADRLRPADPCAAAHARADNLQLTVFEPERRRFERAELRLPRNGDVTLLNADQTDKLATYDLIVSVGRLPSAAGRARPCGTQRACWRRAGSWSASSRGLRCSRIWCSASIRTGSSPAIPTIRSVACNHRDQWTLAFEQAGFDYSRSAIRSIMARIPRR